jgi:hypothetical protein
VKKRLKKLALAKETVRHLEEPALGNAAGGTADSYGYGCPSWVCATTNGRFECAAPCLEPASRVC